MSEINTTPLVDIMLVLLIIFLITIPIITKTVPVSLPKAANIPTKTKPENITISVDINGGIWWNGFPVADRDALIKKVVVEAVKVPQPEVHIRGDAGVRYEAIGKTLYAIQRGGIVKIGFITEPDRGLGR
jgi:biopolymer transport protein ExbD